MELYQTLLAKIARALDGAGISYMIIGGQAVLLHGEPRLTREIDVTVGIDASVFLSSLLNTQISPTVYIVPQPLEHRRRHCPTY